jgi:hypothetical protein
MFPLRNDFNSSLPIATLSADFLNTVANILNDLDGIGCHIDRNPSGYGWKIVIDSVIDGGGAIRPEWAQWVSGSTSFTVKYGPLLWGGNTLNAGASDYTVSFSGAAAGEVRWLYVEGKTDLSYTPQVLLGANGYLPVDAPNESIFRMRLSQWTFSAPGGTLKATKTAIAHEGGELHFTGIAPPP